MSSNTGLLTPIVLIGLFAQGLGLVRNSPCTNPEGSPGICVSGKDCAPLVAIITKSMITHDERVFIRNSKCGEADGKSLYCCSRKWSLPKPPHCGTFLEDRIVGGQKTDLDEFPWTALIQYRKPNGKFGFHCGASVINSRYVVTAGHCIKAIPNGWQVIGVRLGEHDINTEIDCNDEPSTEDTTPVPYCADPVVDVNIDKIIVHEHYNPITKSQWDDIALIKFVRDVSFSPFIKPICLPIDQAERSHIIVGRKAVAAGWGRTENASASNIKLKVTLDIANANSCGATYEHSGVTLRNTQICAGGMKGEDTCSGDSGGPLMMRIKTYYFLYGIVSFGPSNCGTKGVPGVYTNVPKFIDWIESKLE